MGETKKKTVNQLAVHCLFEHFNYVSIVSCAQLYLLNYDHKTINSPAIELNRYIGKFDWLVCRVDATEHTKNQFITIFGLRCDCQFVFNWNSRIRRTHHVDENANVRKTAFQIIPLSLLIDRIWVCGDVSAATSFEQTPSELLCNSQCGTARNESIAMCNANTVFANTN